MKTKNLTAPQPSISLNDWAKGQVKKLTQAFSSFDAERQAELYRDELVEMAKANTCSRVEAAVDKAIREVRDYAPSIAALWSMIPPAFNPNSPTPTCEKCRATFGWLFAKTQRGNDVVKRCKHDGQPYDTVRTYAHEKFGL